MPLYRGVLEASPALGVRGSDAAFAPLVVRAEPPTRRRTGRATLTPCGRWRHFESLDRPLGR